MTNGGFLEKNFDLFCLSHDDNHFQTIKDLNYIPVVTGLGNYGKEWIRDNTGENISKKNTYYGELSFHYWYWKNKLNLDSNKWFGFCHYRRFWRQINELHMEEATEFKKQIIKSIPQEWEKHQIILIKPFYINDLKLSKVLKRGLNLILKKPQLIINKNLRTINFHFDMWHGKGNLKKAIDLLEKEDRDDFNHFVNTELSFNPFHMFFSNSPKLVNNYYNSLFSWLSKCEKLFGFDNLKGYETRIYAFIAERYMSYWFKKNSNYLEWSMIHYDISKGIS